MSGNISMEHIGANAWKSVGWFALGTGFFATSQWSGNALLTTGALALGLGATVKGAHTLATEVAKPLWEKGAAYLNDRYEGVKNIKNYRFGLLEMAASGMIVSGVTAAVASDFSKEGIAYGILATAGGVYCLYNYGTMPRPSAIRKIPVTTSTPLRSRLSNPVPGSFAFTPSPPRGQGGLFSNYN